MANPHRRKVGNYLLNKSLQLRYALLVTLISVAITTILGTMIVTEQRIASNLNMEALKESTLADDPEVAADINSKQATDDRKVAVMMSAVGGVLILVLFHYLVVMTHKVAGPLYKISNYFDRMAEGQLGQVYPLRKGDMLIDFYETFHDAHDKLRARHVDENEVIGAFLRACQSAGISEQDLPPLRALAEHYHERIQALS